MVWRLPTPVRDRVNMAARKLPIWSVYLICLLPVPWLFYLGQSGGLGREPIQALEHELGMLALQFLIAGLCITPLRDLTGINLVRLRRSIGLIAFAYIAVHLLVWLVLDVGIASQIWKDIIKRPYITIGMGAFLLLVPLAVTSNNRSIRKMGASWHRLHTLVYPACVLSAVHFIMVQKVWEIEPIVYFAAIATLLAIRIPRQVRRLSGQRALRPAAPAEPRH